VLKEVMGCTTPKGMQQEEEFVARLRFQGGVTAHDDVTWEFNAGLYVFCLRGLGVETDQQKL
jgi:hypothetical protein